MNKLPHILAFQEPVFDAQSYVGQICYIEFEISFQKIVDCSLCNQNIEKTTLITVRCNDF